MKNILNMIVEDFQNLPKLSTIDENIIIDSVVILPATTCHDNGFMSMFYVLCKGYEPIGIISGISDILHINGGDGTNTTAFEDYSTWHNRTTRNLTYNSRWKIDCLPCGLIRLTSENKLYFTHINCSDVELFTKE